MGSRHSHHQVVHHHHPPPQPSLQERLNNVKNKMDLEVKDHERFSAEMSNKTRQLSEQTKERTDEFNRSMALIDAQRSKDNTEQDRVQKELEARIEEQIREIDFKLETFENERIQNLTQIEQFSIKVNNEKKKSDQYLKNKESEEVALKQELDKTIKQREDLVKTTEDSQEKLLNNRALTNESIRRAETILMDLLWIPERSVRNTEIFTTLSKNLGAYISMLLLNVDAMQDFIDQPGIAASFQETLKWVEKNFPSQVLQDVNNHSLKMVDLIEIVQNEEDIKSELPNLTGYNVRKLKRELNEVKQTEETFRPNINYQLEKFGIHTQSILMWKAEADSTAVKLLHQKDSAKLLT